jgi:exosome complex component RRP46
VIQEINNDGCLLATIINATTIALMDAGIPIKSLIAACSTVIKEDEIEITKKNMDVTLDMEQQSCRANLLFAFNGSLEGVVMCQSLGMFSEDEYWKVLAMSKDACKQIFSAMRKCIEFKEQK